VAIGGAGAAAGRNAPDRSADGFAENDAEAQANITAFRQPLEKVGWIEGRNLAIDCRWGDADPERIRNYAII